jgi:hypothetical protein
MPKRNRNENTAACFTVTGEALTQIARDLMLSDEPGKAWRLLADGLIGEGAETVVRKVLAGEADLNGDSINGIGVEEAHPDRVREYVETLRYIYAGRVRLDKRWYRPSGVILAYGPEDGRYANKMIGRMSAAETWDSRAAWSRTRAKYYAYEGERLELCEAPGELGERRSAYVTFEPCGEAPSWWKPLADAQAAVDDMLAAGRGLERRGASLARPSFEAIEIIRDEGLDVAEANELRDAADAAEHEAYEAALLSIGERVREQAGDDVFPLTLLDGRVVQIPRAPFVHWALSRLPEPPELPEWKPVSTSGIKLPNDDPYHTDWVLGAGLTIADGYSDNVDRPAWAHASELQFAEVDRA